jgi:hypothetical protein
MRPTNVANTNQAVAETAYALNMGTMASSSPASGSLPCVGAIDCGIRMTHGASPSQSRHLLALMQAPNFAAASTLTVLSDLVDVLAAYLKESKRHRAHPAYS